MLQPPSLDDLQTALEPVDALRGEHSQLETWIHESTAALEALHEDLTAWQRDLTRQQAELDQRKAALDEAETQAAAEGRDAATLTEKLAKTQGECRQLEEDNADQAQTIGDLERQLVAAQTELRSVRKHVDELADSLDDQRERELDEHRLWASEFRDMRRLLARQGEMLVSLGAAVPPDENDDQDAAASVSAAAEGDEANQATGDATARTADVRRRGAPRRAHRRPS
jgi:septal ring factor EnvC (AmiA/AmiB activator)